MQQQRQRVVAWPLRIVTLLFALALSACTVSLVPAYDANLAEGLAGANRQTLILFAKLDEGAAASEFKDYSGEYAELIGTFSELRYRAAARPMPPLASRLAKTRIFETFCNSKANPAACLNASPAAIAQIVDTLRTMRATHRAGALSPGIVGGFAREYETAIKQALTVESALKR
jgi:hypothetical protein